MINLVIVNGYPRVGKDSFIDLCIPYLEDGGVFCEKRSSVDKVKDTALTFGWDREKTPENRVMLSELKDYLTKHFDIPFKDITNRVERGKVVFSCMREPSEIKKAVSWCKENGFGCKTVLIRGKNEDDKQLSHSDLLVLGYDYDVEVENYQSIYQLDECCEEFVKGLI